jgi:tetratricopeptide (TPR) repeat protein
MSMLKKTHDRWFELKIRYLTEKDPADALLVEFRKMLEELLEVAGRFREPIDRAKVRRIIFEALEAFTRLGGSRDEFPRLVSVLGSDVDEFNELMRTDLEVFGREAELRWLDEALRDPEVAIVQVIGFGGMGKTALINEWLRRLKKDLWRGVRNVCANSFPGGEREGVATDQFIDRALEHFGASTRTGSNYERGRRLGELLSGESVVVLDSIESLQHPPRDRREGELKEQAILGLLETILAKGIGGLCIVTSRLELSMRGLTARGAEWSRLEDSQSTVRSDEARDRMLCLGPLHKRAGADVLWSAGVRGERAELEAAADEMENVPLSLRLQGNILKTTSGGDVLQRHSVSLREADSWQGNPIQNTMRQYQELIGEPKWSVARCLGFFDRPAPLHEFAKVWKHLPVGDPAQKNELLLPWAIKEFRQCGILSPASGPEADTLIDAHPLVRQYFSEELRSNHEDEWKAGHELLFRSLCEGTQRCPDDVNGLTRLAEAVRHGCEAKQYVEALGVYRERMQRDPEHPVSKRLGHIGLELSALRGFFETPWTRTASGLDGQPALRAFVLHEAGYDLMAECRHAEALEPLRSALALYESVVDRPAEAAKLLDDLTFYYHSIGKLDEALEAARRCVEFADRSDDSVQVTTKRTTLAKALHYLGRSQEAKEVFLEAQARQVERTEDLSRLGHPEILFTSTWGFRDVDLMLDWLEHASLDPGPEADPDRLKRRKSCDLAADRTAKIEQFAGDRELDRARASLSWSRVDLGRALLAEDDGGRRQSLERALAHANEAVDHFSQSSQENEKPRGLLTRAMLHRLLGSFAEAEADILGATEIAKRGKMRLHLIDCNLERCRLLLGKGEEAEARKVASRMVVDFGNILESYGRRTAEWQQIQRKID